MKSTLGLQRRPRWPCNSSDPCRTMRFGSSLAASARTSPRPSFSMRKVHTGIRMTAAATLLVVSGWAAMPACAQGLSTERLDELCRDPASELWREVGQWLCPAYIRGLIGGARLQALYVAGKIDGHRDLMQFCVPEHSTAGGDRRRSRLHCGASREPKRSGCEDGLCRSCRRV